MRLRPHALVALALAAVTTAALSGCTSATAGAGPQADGKVHVVASTDVYGQIAKEIGGDRVTVVSLIDSISQDPHAFEASAKEKLAVNKAQLVVMNGGGYDGFMDGLVKDAKAPVIVAADLAPDAPKAAPGTATPTPTPTAADGDHGHADDHGHTHVAGFNEHVWYDPALMAQLADQIADRIGTLDPAARADVTARAATFTAGAAKITASLETVKAAGHAHIFVTEPVPLRLTDVAGLHNVTPAAFTEAVEEGNDVAPATLLESVNTLRDEHVKVVIANAQTGGAETTKIIAEAKKLGIPVLEWTELIPDGKTYLGWMQENVDALSKALTR